MISLYQKGSLNTTNSYFISELTLHTKNVLQIDELPNPTRIRSIKFVNTKFYPHFSGFTAFGRVTFSIKPGADIKNVDVIMERLFKIKGKITFNNGVPLAKKSIKIGFNLLRQGRTNIYTTSTTRTLQTDADGNFFYVVYRPGVFILSVNYMGLSTESEPFMLDKDNSPQEVVLTLNGNPTDLIPPPEKPKEEKQHRPSYIPDYPTMWIMNPTNGHVYKWIACDGRENAQKQASDENAYLVTITSKEEQIWLEAIFGKVPYWIGLTNSKEEGEWRWENGEPVTYTNWQKKEYDPMADDDVPPFLKFFGVKGEDRRRQEDEEDYALMSSKFGMHPDIEFGKWEVSDSVKDSYIAIIEKDSLTTTPAEKK